jgi:hypothetical protein
MAAMQKKNLDTPDETRPFPNGKVEVTTLGGLTFSRAILEPGWKWSESVKPMAGTDSCQAPHSGYIIAGRIHIVMDDGSELEFDPHDTYMIPPGHDGWVVGNEPCIMLDFIGMADYAKQ